jgi:hypothetical protein
MIDLGYTYETSEPEMAKTEDKPRIDYPQIYIRERKGIKVPKFPGGDFYTVMKVRVAGFRDPTDGEKSVDLEVMEMSPPVDEEVAMQFIGGIYEEEEDDDDGKFSEKAAIESFRQSLKSQIGQSG